MTDQLKQLMNNMADEVKSASLHEQAVFQSRRTTKRRTVLAAVAALTVVGGGMAGFNTLAASEPTGDMAAEQSTADARFEETDARPPVDYPVAELDGVFYDSWFEQGVSSTIATWSSNAPEPVELVTGGPDAGFYNTGVISSDARYVAYLGFADTEGDDVDRRVVVHDLVEDTDRELTDFPDSGGACSLPSWSPDGRLFVDHGTKSNQRFGFYDPATGDFTPSASPVGCQVTVAEDDNGEDLFIAVHESEGVRDIVLTTASGETTTSPVARKLPDEHGVILKLVDVSSDGRYACLRVGDVSDDEDSVVDRMPLCEHIVQIDTGDLVTVIRSLDEGPQGDSPVGTGGLWTLAVPGHILVYNTAALEYILIDMNGNVVDTVSPDYDNVSTEPLLLDYMPAG